MLRSHQNYLSSFNSNSSFGVENMGDYPVFTGARQQREDRVMERKESFIGVTLCDEQLWNQFKAIGTEMVLTKIGRRVFPSFRVRFHGLEPHAHYNIMMDIEQIDTNRYKFQNGQWIVSGKGELPYRQDWFVHPLSSSTGRHVMNSIVSFHKIKLTNAASKLKKGAFLLHSMHRYRLRVHVARSGTPQEIFSFRFPQTDFITVTAYQNSRLSRLKIEKNPFARGFRPDGARGKVKQGEIAEEYEIPQPKKVCVDQIQQHAIVHHNERVGKCKYSNAVPLFVTAPYFNQYNSSLQYNNQHNIRPLADGSRLDQKSFVPESTLNVPPIDIEAHKQVYKVSNSNVALQENNQVYPPCQWDPPAGDVPWHNERENAVFYNVPANS